MVVFRTQPRPVKPTPSSIVTANFTVLRDDRESDAGWTFAGMTERRAKKDYLVVVPLRDKRLMTGDYTIAGLEEMVCIERKQIGDLFASLSAPRSDPGRRERFKAEHERMASMIAAGGHAAVIIEAKLSDVWENPPLESGLNPNSVLGTFHGWAIRFGVSWVFAGGRREAEIAAYGRLKAAWEALKDRADGAKVAAGRPLFQVFDEESRSDEETEFPSLLF